MKRYRLTTCALSLLTLFAVAPAARDASAAPPRRTSASVQRRTSNNARPQLRCSPGRLRRGDTLTLSMPARHGGYLAVVDPNGTYFFITSGDAEALASERNAGANPSLTADAFRSMRQLRLSTTETKAVSYVNPAGGRRADAVFGETGWYKILISHRSFEREEPSADGQCRIYYSDRRRGGR